MQNHYNSNPEDVNLMPLLRFIKRRFDSLGKRVNYLTRVFEKYIYLISSFAGVGVTLGVLYYLLSTPVYKSTAIIASNLLSNEYSESFINELRWLTREKNYDGLSDLLKLDSATVKKVKKIEYEKFHVGGSDSIIGTPFKVHVYIEDNKILDTLQYSLINFLENNSYALKRKNIRENMLKEYSEVMNSEIIELDSIKRILTIKGGLNETTLASYEQILDMYNQKLDVLEKLALLRNYEVIQGFTFFRKPYSPRIRHIIFISLFFGFIGYLYALRKNRNLKKKYTQVALNKNKEKELFIS